MHTGFSCAVPWEMFFWSVILKPFPASVSLLMLPSDVDYRKFEKTMLWARRVGWGWCGLWSLGL